LDTAIMWIFTVNGFFTVIQDRKDPSYVWLRARLREDIERNFPGVEVTEHPGADYLYRAKLPREQVAQRVMELVMENNVTSHFKDVMIRTAAKPKFGNRSTMLYGVWHAGADMQPYPPYSKNPRVKVGNNTVQKGTQRVNRGGAGVLPYQVADSYTYGGNGSGRYGSEFDWNRNSWGGVSHADPAPPSGAQPQATSDVSDEDMEAWWLSLTDEERDEILDQEEAELRRRETTEEYESAVRALEVKTVMPAPRSRKGNRKRGRKGGRKNRHNQYTQLGFSDSQARQEATNRETYLAKKHGGK
jgi:hypothetical protein